MAYYLRTARVAYDNIAAASVTGRERTIKGTSLSSELPTGGERWITSAGGVSTHTTSKALNRMIASSGAGVTSLHPAENIVSTQ